MPEKLIYLIRHAHPDYPHGEKMCLGRRCDLPLSRDGQEQALALRRYFASLPLEAVYSSPLLRARQTAQAVAADKRPLIILDDLIELDGGEWDGLPFCEIRKRYPGSHLRPLTPPGGETDESGLSRMQKALNAAAKKTEHCAAIVAHGGVNRLLLCHLLGRPPQDKKQISQDYACVNLLALDGGAWTVRETGLRPGSLSGL